MDYRAELDKTATEGVRAPQQLRIAEQYIGNVALGESPKREGL